MGNTEPESKELKIYIETEKPFYNSGSSIEGVVFVEALNNFKFDALFLRIEGKSCTTQGRNSVNGTKAAPPIAINSWVATHSTALSTSSKCTRTSTSKRESMLILFPSRSLRIYPAPFSPASMEPRSSTI